MPTVKNTSSRESKISVAAEVKNHGNDPFILMKVAKAKEIMSKVNLPDHLQSSTI